MTDTLQIVRGWLYDNLLLGIIIPLLLGFYGQKFLVWFHNRLTIKEFRKIFGVKAKEYYLAFGAMVVHPQLLQMAMPVASKLSLYPLAKPTNPNFSFSAQKVASGCEIRAVAYVSSLLETDKDLEVLVGTDDDISGKLDLDFVAFGALSNSKTLDIFSNPSNTLATYEQNIGCFVSKKNQRPLYSPQPKCDYGIILKIHPKQFPARTWICCAGVGEWGTSGSAYYLAKKWRHLAKHVREQDNFVAIIEVDTHPGQDESARMIDIFIERTSEEQWWRRLWNKPTRL